MQPLEQNNIRLAATVMLVRDSDRGLEVYMVQRPGRGAFPDLHVFPGGKVDADDWAPEYCSGLDDQQASALLGVARGGLRYWVAVARECFEECGVLLAHQNGKPVDFARPGLAARFAQHREDLLAGKVSFSKICEMESLAVACDRLAYFSHWITPEAAPRRFDTRFFLAALPHQQATLADTQETADDQWDSPGEALLKYASKQWLMIEPTLRSLETLSRYTTVDEALLAVNLKNHVTPLTSALSLQGMQKYH
jgi:8-oxo-dGTP pyrophosphatase MutT (NUDIX family)